MVCRVTRGLLAIVIAGCQPAAPSNTSKPAAAPIDSARPAGPPCGGARLQLHDDPQCDSKRRCMPGVVRKAAGTCTIVASPAFDLDAGRDRHTLFEGARPILSEDAPPYARRVVFDPRIATPKGLRVGMTGAEIVRLVPEDETKCAFDESGWEGHLLCRFRDLTECDAEDANWFLVVFEPGDRTGAPAIGAAARALIRTRRVLAIDLGPYCGD